MAQQQRNAHGFGRRLELKLPVGQPDENGSVGWLVPAHAAVPESATLKLFQEIDRRRLGHFVAKEARKVLRRDSATKRFLQRLDVQEEDKVSHQTFHEAVARFVEDHVRLTSMEQANLVFSEPTSCKVAFLLSISVMLLIIVSTVSFIIETMPSMRVQRSSAACCLHLDQNDVTEALQTVCQCEPEPSRIFFLIETVCIAVFTVEYLVRLGTCISCRFGESLELHLNLGEIDMRKDSSVTWHGNLKAFLKNTLNVIDLAAILPYYLAFVLDGDNGSFGFLRVLRLARVFRVFKMGKYNKGMQLVLRVMVNSAPALNLLAFFQLLGMVLFGSMIYYCENGEWATTEEYPNGVYLRRSVNGLYKEPSPFTSIPACFWWVIVTTSTVGYGDTYPTTDLGKVVGSLCMVTGLLVLALPITIIGANFANEYTKAREQEAKEKADEEARALKRQQQEKARLDKEAAQVKIKAHGDSLKDNTVNPSGQAHHHNPAGGPRRRFSIMALGALALSAPAQNLGGDGPASGSFRGAKSVLPVSGGLREEPEDDSDREAEEADDAEYTQSKIETQQKCSAIMSRLRELYDLNKLTKFITDVLVEEMSHVQKTIGDGREVETRNIQRQVTMVLSWIERAESESSVILEASEANELRKMYFDFLTSLHGRVCRGAP